MKIAVLMTCHNRRDTTIRCLQSLLPQLTANDAVFIVDDGSTDGTGAAIANIEKEYNVDIVPAIKILIADGFLFWAKGMHLAWSTSITSNSRYDFYLWLNDDVVLQQGAINGLIKDWKESGDSCSVIVGACASDRTLKYSSYGATDENDRRIIPNGQCAQLALGWFNGNVVLVPHQTFLSIGMISSDYSHAKADYDYAERLRRRGIPFYSSSNYVGCCERYESINSHNPNLFCRVSMLFRPSRYNLKDLFVFRKRYYGYWRAIISSFHLICMRVKG